MILTVTPNPSLDYLFEAGRLNWDDANRVNAPRVRPGGQGINVSRAARALGGDSVALALLGGPTGAEIERFLTNEGTPSVIVRIEGDTRIFVGIRETETGRSLLVNPRGPHIPSKECGRITREVSQAITSIRPNWVATCGSIPPGMPDHFYADIGRLAHSAGARFVVDCDGEALRLAAEQADLIVPNQHEAERLVQHEIDSLKTAADAALELCATGPKLVAITLGEEGAVLTDGSNVWHATPPVFSHGSAVGAGDAFLAALLLGLEQRKPLDDVLCTAVAAGAAVLCSRGSNLLQNEEVAQLTKSIRARSLT